MSKRPIWSDPTPAWTISMLFTLAGSLRIVWEWPPTMRSTPAIGTNQFCQLQVGVETDMS